MYGAMQAVLRVYAGVLSVLAGCTADAKTGGTCRTDLSSVRASQRGADRRDIRSAASEHTRVRSPRNLMIFVGVPVLVDTFDRPTPRAQKCSYRLKNG